MNARWMITAIVCLAAATASAQTNSYHHHRNYTSRGLYGGGFYGGYYPSFHHSTEFGDAATGLANLVQAEGQYLLARSQAIQNLTLAEQQRMRNLVEYQQSRLEIDNLRAQRKAAKLANDKQARELAIASRVPYTPPAIVNKAGVAWIDPLKSEIFAGHRAALDKQIARLAAAKTVAERDVIIDGINESCQELIVALDEHKAELSANAYDASCRFVNRLYDSVAQPVAMNVVSVR
jgi:hypothetical protein